MKKLHLATGLLTGMLVAACSGGSDPAPAPVDAAPTISAIADQNTMANVQSNAIAFTVDDEQIASLTITAMSDNQDTVRDVDLLLGGTGTARSLTVTPVADTLGDAVITITVTDTAGLSANSSFLLTIDPQQLSFRDFVRSAFAADPNSEPTLINAVQFDQDAGDDDFADLIGP